MFERITSRKVGKRESGSIVSMSKRRDSPAEKVYTVVACDKSVIPNVNKND